MSGSLSGDLNLQFNSSIRMALRELHSSIGRLIVKGGRRNGPSTVTISCRRYASTEASEAPTQDVSQDIQDLESQSTFWKTSAPDEKVKSYDPIKRASARRRVLPPSRYVGVRIAMRNYN